MTMRGIDRRSEPVTAQVEFVTLPPDGGKSPTGTLALIASRPGGLAAECLDVALDSPARLHQLLRDRLISCTTSSGPLSIRYADVPIHLKVLAGNPADNFIAMLPYSGEPLSTEAFTLTWTGPTDCPEPILLALIATPPIGQTEFEGVVARLSASARLDVSPKMLPATTTWFIAAGLVGLAYYGYREFARAFCKGPRCPNDQLWSRALEADEEAASEIGSSVTLDELLEMRSELVRPRGVPDSGRR